MHIPLSCHLFCLRLLPLLLASHCNHGQVSLVEMSDEARVALCRYPACSQLVSYMKGRMDSRAKSHGYYLPALDQALQLAQGDAGRANKVFLLFLSDGAPSDHNYLVGWVTSGPT